MGLVLFLGESCVDLLLFLEEICVDLFLFLEGAVWICMAQQESIVKVLVFIAYLPVR